MTYHMTGSSDRRVAFKTSMLVDRTRYNEQNKYVSRHNIRDSAFVASTGDIFNNGGLYAGLPNWRQILPGVDKIRIIFLRP